MTQALRAQFDQFDTAGRGSLTKQQVFALISHFYHHMDLDYSVVRDVIVNQQQQNNTIQFDHFCNLVTALKQQHSLDRHAVVAYSPTSATATTTPVAMTVAPPQATIRHEEREQRDAAQQAPQAPIAYDDAAQVAHQNALRLRRLSALDFETRLMLFYARFNPSKIIQLTASQQQQPHQQQQVPFITETLERFAGREHSLFQTLEQKYGEFRLDSSQDSDLSSSDEWRSLCASVPADDVVRQRLLNDPCLSDTTCAGVQKLIDRCIADRTRIIRDFARPAVYPFVVKYRPDLIEQERRFMQQRQQQERCGRNDDDDDDKNNSSNSSPPPIRTAIRSDHRYPYVGPLTTVEDRLNMLISRIGLARARSLNSIAAWTQFLSSIFFDHAPATPEQIPLLENNDYYDKRIAGTLLRLHPDKHTVALKYMLDYGAVTSTRMRRFDSASPEMRSTAPDSSSSWGRAAPSSSTSNDSSNNNDSDDMSPDGGTHPLCPFFPLDMRAARRPELLEALLDELEEVKKSRASAAEAALVDEDDDDELFNMIHPLADPSADGKRNRRRTAPDLTPEQLAMLAQMRLKAARDDVLERVRGYCWRWCQTHVDRADQLVDNARGNTVRLLVSFTQKFGESFPETAFAAAKRYDELEASLSSAKNTSSSSIIGIGNFSGVNREALAKLPPHRQWRERYQQEDIIESSQELLKSAGDNNNTNNNSDEKTTATVGEEREQQQSSQPIQTLFPSFRERAHNFSRMYPDILHKLYISGPTPRRRAVWDDDDSDDDKVRRGVNNDNNNNNRESAEDRFLREQTHSELSSRRLLRKMLIQHCGGRWAVSPELRDASEVDGHVAAIALSQQRRTARLVANARGWWHRIVRFISFYDLAVPHFLVHGSNRAASDAYDVTRYIAQERALKMEQRRKELEAMAGETAATEVSSEQRHITSTDFLFGDSLCIEAIAAAPELTLVATFTDWVKRCGPEPSREQYDAATALRDNTIAHLVKFGTAQQFLNFCGHAAGPHATLYRGRSRQQLRDAIVFELLLSSSSSTNSSEEITDPAEIASLLRRAAWSWRLYRSAVIGGDSAVQRGSCYEWRLLSLLRRAAPEVLPKIPHLLDKFSGREEGLISALCLKYSVRELLPVRRRTQTNSNNNPSLTRSDLGPEQLRNRIVKALLRLHPKTLLEVDLDILEGKLRGVDNFIRALCFLYNASEETTYELVTNMPWSSGQHNKQGEQAQQADEQTIATTTTEQQAKRKRVGWADQAAATSSSIKSRPFKERLILYFTRYCPDRLAVVDSIVADDLDPDDYMRSLEEVFGKEDPHEEEEPTTTTAIAGAAASYSPYSSLLDASGRRVLPASSEEVNRALDCLSQSQRHCCFHHCLDEVELDELEQMLAQYNKSNDSKNNNSQQRGPLVLSPAELIREVGNPSIDAADWGDDINGANDHQQQQQQQQATTTMHRPWNSPLPSIEDRIVAILVRFSTKARGLDIAHNPSDRDELFRRHSSLRGIVDAAVKRPMPALRELARRYCVVATTENNNSDLRAPVLYGEPRDIETAQRDAQLEQVIADKQMLRWAAQPDSAAKLKKLRKFYSRVIADPNHIDVNSAPSLRAVRKSLEQHGGDVNKLISLLAAAHGIDVVWRTNEQQAQQTQPQNNGDRNNDKSNDDEQREEQQQQQTIKNAAPTDDNSYRSRVLAIFNEYAPEKAFNVDAVLEKYKGHEERLITALKQKYMPPSATAAAPAPAVTTTAQDDDNDNEPNHDYDDEQDNDIINAVTVPGMDYRSRVARFYAHYCSNDPKRNSLEFVDATLERFKGKEQELMAALVQKYRGPEPHFSWRNRLIAIFNRFEPAKVESVDRLLSQYKGIERELIKALLRKYETKAVVGVTTVSAHSSSSNSAAAAAAAPAVSSAAAANINSKDDNNAVAGGENNMTTSEPASAATAAAVVAPEAPEHVWPPRYQKAKGARRSKGGFFGLPRGYVLGVKDKGDVLGPDKR